MRAALLPLCLVQAACATTVSTADPMPNRGDVGGALLAAMVCPDAVTCPPPFRRAVFTRLRCVPAGEGDFEGVVLCHYAGHVVRADGGRAPIASDCAYLSRDEALRWRVAYFPDAEFCEA